MIAKVSPQQGPKDRHPNWLEIYNRIPAAKVPWHSESLDPDFADFLKQHQIESILDIGCGLGSQSYALSKMGYQVTGTDIAETAINHAMQKYAHPNLNFLVDDVFASKIDQGFDAICDRGLFHVLALDQLSSYIKYLHARTQPEGLIALKCFSTANIEAGFGPIRYSAKTIKFLFKQHFDLISCKPSIFIGPTATQPKALFCQLKRR